jgi:hypothetical protein
MKITFREESVWFSFLLKVDLKKKKKKKGLMRLQTDGIER